MATKYVKFYMVGVPGGLDGIGFEFHCPNCDRQLDRLPLPVEECQEFYQCACGEVSTPALTIFNGLPPIMLPGQAAKRGWTDN